MNNLMAQDYDGASNMIGTHSGAGFLFKKEHLPTLCSHCLYRSLNLSVSSANTAPRSMKDMMEVCLEISCLIKFSQKRERKLDKII